MTTILEERTTAASKYRLTAEEIEQFHRDGVLGPFAIGSPEEMGERRPKIEAALHRDAPDHKQRLHNRHLDSPSVHELASHPAVIERMAQIAGPDLLIWRTNFFIKGPDASIPSNNKEIPWHQDRNYWPLEPEVVISAWLAVDEATVENSCVQVIPGSHRKVIPHIKSTEDMAFGMMADLNHVDTSQAVNFELKPGEFFLFNERTLHHSEPNRSGKRRIGLAIRVIPPIVRVLKYDSPQHKMVVVHGQDRMGFNPLGQPPAGE